MQKIRVIRDGDILTIGESPQLIVNLKNQENYIKIQQRIIPYRKKVIFSRDLLSGKRENVLNTAVKHYYSQACTVAEGLRAAEIYRPMTNTTVREIR